jgi:hypothetical protein
LILRIHTFTGLVAFINLMLYGAVGMAALFDARTATPVVWEREFAMTAGESDRAVAERVVRLLGLSLATPVHDFAIGHDAQRRLVLDFYHVNGRHRVTVLDHPGRLRVEQTRASLWQYLSTLHVTTAAFRSGDWRLQLWAWWNEFAMWCLVLMTASGGWMWWSRRDARRPRAGGGMLVAVHRYTALCAIVLLAIFGISAVRMAHRAWLKAGAALGLLERIHRLRGGGPSPILGVALLALSATGLVLWWKLPPLRRVGACLLAFGICVAGGLIWWMRAYS